jgi:hypothetical protein
MNSKPTIKIMMVLLAVLISQALSTEPAALGAKPDDEAIHSFKLNLVSRMHLDVVGTTREITATTDVRYRWRCKDRERTLSIDSLLITAEEDGREIMNTFMSREKFIDIKLGKTNEIVADNAPDQLKKILQESFGAPLCTLQIDEQGKEIKRTVVAGEGAKNLVDNGMIANALLFHPPFLRNSNDWSAETAMSMGHGGYARGSLNYKKQAGEQSRQTCKVSGTLTNERFKQPETPVTTRNSRYVVTGNETFDPVLKEWISGKLTMEFSNQMEADQKIVGSSRGTIVATFERIGTLSP